MDIKEKINIGHNGFVRLINYMGSELDLCNSYRVFPDRYPDQWMYREDTQLIRYLIRTGDTRAFRMCELKFNIRCPLYLLNYFSQQAGSQSLTNNNIDQGIEETQTWFRHVPMENRDEGVAPQPEPSKSDYSLIYSLMESEMIDYSSSCYNNLVNNGVSHSQACKVLPSSKYVDIYWKIDLYNLLDFIKLNFNNNIDMELRDYVKVVYGIVEKIYPRVIAAFNNFVLDSLTLSAFEIQVIDFINNCKDNGLLEYFLKDFGYGAWVKYDEGYKKWELDESDPECYSFCRKCETLGIDIKGYINLID